MSKKIYFPSFFEPGVKMRQCFALRCECQVRLLANGFVLFFLAPKPAHAIASGWPPHPGGVGVVIDGFFQGD